MTPAPGSEAGVTSPDDRGPAPGAQDHPHGPVFIASLVVGWAVIAFGLHGLVTQSNVTGVLRLLIGLNVLNDALVVPLLIGVAVLARRVLPGWLVVPVQIGLITSAVVALYAYPLVGSWGKSARAGSSRLPWNYAHNLIVVLAAIWVVCALLALWSWHRRRPSPT